ncbi:MAG: CDP-glycerol glycerophosphotransferase family protein [Anaerocolumna sp.]
MITVVIKATNKELAAKSLQNIQERNLEFPGILVQILQLPGTELTLEDIHELETMYEFVQFANVYDTVAEGCNEIIANCKTKYMSFITEGSRYRKDTLESIKAMFKNCPHVNIIKIRSVKGLYKNYIGPYDRMVDVNREPQISPFYIDECIFRTNSLQKTNFNTNLASHDIQGVDLLLRMLEEQPEIGATVKGGILATFTPFDHYKIYPNSQERRWYDDITKTLFTKVERYRKNEQQVPFHLQYVSIFMIKTMFIHNNGTRNKHVFDNDIAEFFGIIQYILQGIYDEIIQSKNCIDQFKVKIDLMLFLMQLKNDEVICSATLDNKVCIDLLDEEKEGIVLEGRILNLLHNDNVKIQCLLDNTELEVTVTKRYSENMYFGHSVNRWESFKVLIPNKFLEKKCKMEIKLNYYGQVKTLRYTTGRWPSKLYSGHRSAYCVVKNSVIAIYKKKLIFAPASFKHRLKKELTYLLRIFKSNRRMAFLRILYWITKPYFSGKKIWITYDKLYKGGDCGEYFFKYVAKQKDGIIPKYLINPSYPDAKRLQEEGCNPIFINTKKHFLYFMNASVIATTHANLPIYSGFGVDGFNYFKDLFKADIVCIQHGLAVQYMPHNLNRIYDNLKAFYIAATSEFDNLSKDIYGFDNTDLLVPTGIPRFDGLIGDDKKVILIIPTWRSYLAMPPQVGEARAYAPHFKESVYFYIYNSLINDSQLVACANKYGYRIKYVLHPTISAQSEDFDITNDCIEVLSPLQINYEEVLTQSSLMVTDYSGVQFDFAYQRKPVVYYHTTKLPAHYDEGGFNYGTQAFGELCENHEDIVKVLCEYMENSCRMNSRYKQRVDEFFYYDDLNSCKRIYDDLLKKTKEK